MPGPVDTLHLKGSWNYELSLTQTFFLSIQVWKKPYLKKKNTKHSFTLSKEDIEMQHRGMYRHRAPLWHDQVRQELVLHQLSLPGLWCRGAEMSCTLKPALLFSLFCISHSKGSRSKNSFACLSVLPESFLSQMQLLMRQIRQNFLIVQIQQA